MMEKMEQAASRTTDTFTFNLSIKPTETRDMNDIFINLILNRHVSNSLCNGHTFLV